jgi:hypothetical protein
MNATLAINHAPILPTESCGRRKAITNARTSTNVPNAIACAAAWSNSPRDPRRIITASSTCLPSRSMSNRIERSGSKREATISRKYSSPRCIGMPLTATIRSPRCRSARAAAPPAERFLTTGRTVAVMGAKPEAHWSPHMVVGCQQEVAEEGHRDDVHPREPVRFARYLLISGRGE